MKLQRFHKFSLALTISSTLFSTLPIQLLSSRAFAVDSIKFIQERARRTQNSVRTDYVFYTNTQDKGKTLKNFRQEHFSLRGRTAALVSGSSTWSFEPRVRYLKTKTSATLPNSLGLLPTDRGSETERSFPSELMDGGLSSQYLGAFRGGTLGVQIYAGSASDRWFQSGTRVFEATAFYRWKSRPKVKLVEPEVAPPVAPSVRRRRGTPPIRPTVPQELKEKTPPPPSTTESTSTGEWIGWLEYSNNRPLLNGLPLPGFGYLWEPNARLRILAGLPALSINFQPAGIWELELEALPGRSAQARVGLALSDEERVGLVGEWAWSSFLLSKRSENSQLLIESEQRVYLELVGSVIPEFTVRAQGGYSLGRSIFQGKHLNNTGSGVLEIRPAVFGTIGLQAQF